MVPESETALLERARAGEAEAWDELFDLHYAAAGRFVFQLAPDFTREDVEEVCQETFLTVIKSIHSFRGGCQFQTWLFRIAINKSRDYREKQRAAKRGGGRQPLSLDAEDPETGLKIDPPGDQAGPDGVALNGENAALIGHALEMLGDPCREIIELRYFGDLSYDEISTTLELNPKTVSSRLSKCLDKLAEIARPAFSGEQTAQTPSND